MDDFQYLSQKRKALAQQRIAQDQYNRSLAKAQAEQNKPTGLAAVLSGIGQSIGNVGESLYDIFGKGGASIRDIFTGNIATGKYTKEWEQMRKEQMGDKNMSDKDYYLKTGGKALDAASTVSDFIPGLGTGARVALNVGQGVASGVGQQFADNGSNVTSDDLIKAGLIGGASAGAGQLAGLKLGQKALKNPATSKIGKALQSNVGRAALTGAASGATGGGLASALNGGSFIGGALEGAKTGALGGATIAGTMGLIGSGLNKVNKKITTPTAQTVAETPDAIITKAAAQDIAETPAAATRRSIPVTDYDAGEQTVKVNRANAPTGEYSLGKNAGSTLDGILGPNNARKLPNATLPSEAAQFKNATQTNDVYDFINQAANSGMDVMDYMKGVLTPEDYAAFRQNAADYAALNQLGFEGTNAVNKTNLPQLDRQQYYDDTIGKLKAQGGSMSAADVPDYMKSHLKNDAAKTGGYISDNQSILRELFNDDQSDIGDLYKRYEDLAQAANQNEVYTPENMAAGLRMDDDLARRATDAILKEYGARRDIDVNAYPSLRKPIDVGFEGAPSDETVYTKRILPGKTEQNLPAKATPAQIAPVEDTPLIQKGTPEYEALKRQEYIDNRARELRNTVTENVRNQYGTIRLNDRINGLDDAIMELAEYGLTKRSEIDGFAKRITGKDGEMSKAIRKAMNNAGKTDGRLDITMDDVFRSSGAAGNKAAIEKIKSKFNSFGKKYTVDADGGMNRSDMYDFGKELEREGYRNIEKGGRTQNTDTEVYGEAMRTLGEQYIAKATDGVDMSKYINANRLKNLLPGNEAWAAHVDQSIPAIKTVSDARSFMAAPTKLSLLADAAEYNKGTYGSNMGNFSKDSTQAVRAMTSGRPLRAGTQFVATKILDSDAARDRITRNAMKQYKNIEAGGTGKTGVKGAISKAANWTGEKIGNIGKTLNNDNFSSASYAGVLPTFGEAATAQIARQAGLGAARSQDTNSRLNAAQNELLDAQTQYQNAANTLASLPTANTTANKGVQQLQTISNAMEAALAAGDITAYGQLADLYKKAYAIYGQETATPKALSATQSKALAAAQQLDQLAQMTPDAGTALANSPLGFLVNLGGGNQYANQAKALATTLGYLLSGANIRETEAERIGQAYVPNAFDSEPVRQQKLARAKQLIQSYMASTDDLGA